MAAFGLYLGHHSASSTQTYSYTASGGLTFGGVATALRYEVFSASGGLTFGGAANQARIAARETSGGLVFGGAATVAFHEAVRVVVAVGGIVFGGAGLLSFVGRTVGNYLVFARRRARR